MSANSDSTSEHSVKKQTAPNIGETLGSFVRQLDALQKSRRNLFVHTDGRVSSQYLRVCGSNNVQIQDGLVIGKQLAATPEYLKQAYICLSEIGVKLAHVLWRKLRPDEIQEADKTLNQICYDYLVDEEYEIALRRTDLGPNDFDR
jgi:hypothetical protein